MQVRHNLPRSFQNAKQGQLTVGRLSERVSFYLARDSRDTWSSLEEDSAFQIGTFPQQETDMCRYLLRLCRAAHASKRTTRVT